MSARELEGKVALVTGGASGIGLETARLFIEHGARVVLVDRDAESLRRSAESLGATPAVADVTDAASLAAAVASAVDSLGGLHVLVNSAGIATKHRFLEMPEQAWDAMMTVHAKGTFLATQAAARVMGRGSAVVNLSSIAAELGNPLAVHYAAAKGAIKMITRAAAVSLAPKGIRVNAVGPGTTVTPLTEGRLRDPEMRRAALQRIPMGRLGEPSDVAEVILFLASDRARYVTGQTIYVDGGWTAQLYAVQYEQMQEALLPTEPT